MAAEGLGAAGISGEFARGKGCTRGIGEMESRRLTYNSFVPQLLMEIPEFKTIYDEHITDFDEVLPHVLMGAFTRFLVDAYKKSKLPDANGQAYKQVVDRSLSFMERAIGNGDLGVQNLVIVSFLENLRPWEQEDLPVYYEIKLLLGPQLRKELNLYYPE
jgi:hypothetical protein